MPLRAVPAASRSMIAGEETSLGGVLHRHRVPAARGEVQYFTRVPYGLVVEVVTSSPALISSYAWRA